MIDTRPLWARALAKRSGATMPVRGQRLFAECARQLSRTQFVDFVRAILGLPALYASDSSAWIKRPIGLYRSLESLRRAADADCDRCGGCGYYDAERLDMRCPCTGLKGRDARPKRPRVGDTSFAYRGR